MRVITGRFQGRKLKAPPGETTRPILDRVKVAVFDFLGARLAQPGVLPPLSVLDLFCGGGSLGIESLSRGAAYCAFVDADRAACGCLRENLDHLGIGPEGRIYQSPVETAIIAPPPNGRFSLIFLDPPYRLSEDWTPRATLRRVLERLGADPVVDENATMLWRHADKCEIPDLLPGGWQVEHRRSWGRMAVSVLVRTPREDR